jgi:hypothetical protein
MWEYIFEIFSSTGLYVKQRQKLYDTGFQENATYNAEGFPTLLQKLQLPSLGFISLGILEAFMCIHLAVGSD